MDAVQFDGITKTLCTGADRRRVLGVVIGSLAAVLGGGPVTRAKKGGNNACARFCHTVFKGRAAGQCTAAAARGDADSLCAACEADPDNVCVGDDGEPTCDCETGSLQCRALCDPRDNQCGVECPACLYSADYDDFLCGIPRPT